MNLEPSNARIVLEDLTPPLLFGYAWGFFGLYVEMTFGPFLTGILVTILGCIGLAKYRRSLRKHLKQLRDMSNIARKCHGNTSLTYSIDDGQYYLHSQEYGTIWFADGDGQGFSVYNRL
tara:strand:- start:92500 stop:92856 length:357 start_codon:yes stop_codon:yes gene_type:complete